MPRDDPFAALPRRRTGWRVAAVLVLVAFVAGAIAMALITQYHASWLWWQEPAAPTAAVVPTTGAPASSTTAAAPSDLTVLAAREAALAAQLAALEARQATIDTQAAAAAGNATRAEGLLVAFAARRALDRGLGLGYVEGQLRARFGATQPRAVATVINAARAPVTLEDLRLGLNSIGPDLVSSDRGSWGASLRNALANLVVVHKDGTPSPRPTDRLSRARDLLAGGQVEAALAEVSQLPGASKASRWVDAARRYVAARHALDVIETAAIIGQTQQPAPAPISQPAPIQQSATTTQAGPADTGNITAPAKP
jgi:hypothetical protein